MYQRTACCEGSVGMLSYGTNHRRDKGHSWGALLRAYLELVRDHVPQALVVHWTYEDVRRKLLSSNAADHRLACTCPSKSGTNQAASGSPDSRALPAQRRDTNAGKVRQDHRGSTTKDSTWTLLLRKASKMLATGWAPTSMAVKAVLLQNLSHTVYMVFGVAAGLLKGRGICEGAAKRARLAHQTLDQHANGHARGEGVRVDD